MDKFVINPDIERLIDEKLKEGAKEAADRLKITIQQNLSSQNSLPGQPPSLRTGQLRSSIEVDDFQLDSNMKIRIKAACPYAEIQEFGGVIQAKTAKYLKFKIKNLWRTVKSAIIPARPFFRPAIMSAKDDMLGAFKDRL